MFTAPGDPKVTGAPERPAILVADDSGEIQETLRAWFGEAGYRVICVGSGMEAVRQIRQRSFDVVVTEVILPNGDGLELISALKRFQPTVPEIAYSGGGIYLSVSDCLRVARGFWFLCLVAGVHGTCRTFGPGSYATLGYGLDNKVSSGRRISYDYPYNGNPNWDARR